MIETESQENSELLPSKPRQRSPLQIPSTLDSSPQIEQIAAKQSNTQSSKDQQDKILQEQIQFSDLQNATPSNDSLYQIQQQLSKINSSKSACAAIKAAVEFVQHNQFCKRHSIALSPSLSQKSNNRSSITNQMNATNNSTVQAGGEIDSSIETFQNRNKMKHQISKVDNNQKKAQQNNNLDNSKQNKMINYNNTSVPQCGSLTQVEDNDHSSDYLSSAESDSSESSSEEYIHQCQKKLLGLNRSKNVSSDSTNASSSNNQQFQTMSQQQQYPLQFVCVELNCTEEFKYCCVKCLSQGGHENHQAICVKTINQQIQSQLKMNKLSSVKQKIDQLFDNLEEKLRQCRHILNNQFNEAQSNLQQEAENALNPKASLEQKVQIWKAYYQSEQAVIMEHLNFILEKSDSFFNQIGSRIVNLNPKQLLHIKQNTKYDIIFQQQLKSIEQELQKAESNLSSRAKQALAALPQFNFQSDELENSLAVSIKKFEYPERIEFCQVDKKGEQNGRCLIFWKDGAYRAGYHRGGYSQGICRMVWENGNVYQGEYVNDCKQGQGFFIKYSDNTTYFGSFEQDAKNGLGIEYYPNNTQYVGEFKNWKTHGKGKLIETNTKKVIYEGKWKNGKFVDHVSSL
ncbi:hypothetical protein ABPG74_015698 [Tetrahymena malaccensis]